MDKDNKDIRKELEELEKLIDKVKQQNEEEKKKHKQKPKNTIVRINLASVYSNNFWVNTVISFLVNLIVIFAILKIFSSFVTISNDIYIIYVAGIFTGVEEAYKRYLLSKQVKVVIYTSGLIFLFINLLIIYVIDVLIFVNQFSFVNYLYPIVFVVLFQGVRAVIKNLYGRFTHQNALKKIKRK